MRTIRIRLFFSFISPQPVHLRIGIFPCILPPAPDQRSLFSLFFLGGLICAVRLISHLFFVRILFFRILSILGVLPVILILFIVFVVFVVFVLVILVAESGSILGLRLALDINLIACKFGCKTSVLSFASDSQGQLVIRNNYLCCLLLGIREYSDDLGRREGVLDQIAGVLVPVNDVDLFTAKFIDDIVDADTVYANAGADGVNLGIIGVYGDLGAASRLPRNALDLNDFVLNLGNFLLKQFFDKFGMSAADKDPGAAVCSADVNDIDLDPVCGL